MAAVWALSNRPVSNTAVGDLLPPKLKEPFQEYLKTRGGLAFGRLFLAAETPTAFVTPVNPYALNERVVVQQGTFLCPGDVSRTFEENLLAMPEVDNPANFRRILLPRSVLNDAFDSLHRMNITHFSMFPGLDGYARNLWHRIGFLDSGEFFDETIA